MGRIATVLAGIGLMVFFWVQGERFIATNGPTYDEAVHLAAGHSYLATGDFRLNIEDPPFLKLLWAMPAVIRGEPFEPNPLYWDNKDEWSIGQSYLYSSSNGIARLLAPARRVNLGLGVLLIGLTGWWAYRIWDSPTAGITAAALTALDPTILAMSCILSTDLGLTLFATASLYLAWEFVTFPARWNLHLLGLAIGLMLGSKFSGVFLVMSLLGAILVWTVLGGTLAMPGTGHEPAIRFRTRLQMALGPIVRVGLIAILTLAVIYFGTRLPDWGVGLKQQLVRHQFGDPSFYFWGEVSHTGWIGYFPLAMLLKLPLGSLALIAGTLFLPGMCPRWTRRDAVFVLLPTGLFFGGMMLSGVNIGVRVVLPVFPPLFVLAGRLAARPKTYLRSVLVTAAVIATGYASDSVAPHQLAYFNRLGGGPAGGIQYLGDSNLDWGQDLPGLKAWQDQEGVPIVYLAYHGTAPPRAYGIRYQWLPSSGYLEPPPTDHVPRDAERHIVVISATCLQGIYLPVYGKAPTLYRWLLDRQPTTVIGHSLYVFDLTGDPVAIEKIRTLAGGEGERG